MRLSVCFSIVVLAVALAKASPAAKAVEKKSLVEDAKLESKKEDLQIEDTGSDKDRAKKSATFCVEIKPGSVQPVQVPCKGSQQVVQSESLVAQPVQSYNVVRPSYVQPSYVQSSYVQSMPQASIVLPQQMAAPYQTFQLVQSSPQPCAQPVPSVNIVPSVPQTENVPQASVEAPNSKPDPEEALKDQLKPERIEEASEPLPVPQENLAYLPVAPSYHEHLFALPSSSMMMYPELEQIRMASVFQDSPTVLPSNILTRCPCQNNMAAFSEGAVEPMAVLPYSSEVAGPPTMMPHNARVHIVTHEHGMGPMQGKYRHAHGHTHAHINMNAGVPQSFAVPANQYSTKSLVDSSFGSGISINTYPTTYRMTSPIFASTLRNAENANNSPLAFEINDLMQSNKKPREIDSSAKMEEVKQQADDNKKSIEEETKQN
ncbi:uncharacterized protein LOC143359080 [Halictus rubicundus]|uniref:uncharacterized protein LOC143359080 n=1 Tax=Halictus rubicundus TaxID=77578 RepID=UPI0040363364